MGYSIPRASVSVLIVCSFFCSISLAQHDVARQWNEALLSAIRIDFPAPTVHSRNLYHVSAGMYDAWADTTKE